MRYVKKCLFFAIGILLLSIVVHTPVSAQTPTPESSTLDRLQNEIKDLQNKVADLQGQEKTLSSQIAVMNSQIRLTELRIDATEEEIKQISGDIEIATKKIGELETSLDTLTKVSINRIVATYETGSVKPFEMLFTANGVSDFFVRINYLRIAQANDKELLLTTQQAKNDYENQKGIFQEKKDKVEALRKQLVSYTSQLDIEKKEKESLLSTTKNSEKEYQRRLADALRELGQIQKAATALASSTPIHVNRGDVIGIMGNTGFSSGAHLHFGVYGISRLEDYNYYSSYENPANVLESKNVKWDTGCSNDPQGNTATGNGSFAWPMTPESVYISQGFGTTCWAWMYQGKPHPAFDIVGPLNSAVKAVESGQAYFCRNCTGDGGNGVFLFHSNGKMTLYWHLQ